MIFLTLKTKLRLLRQHVGRGSSLTERSSERNVSRDLRMQTAYSLVTGEEEEEKKNRIVRNGKEEKIIR